MCHHEDYKVNWPEKMTQRRQLDLAALREHGWSQAEMAADEIERLRATLAAALEIIHRDSRCGTNEDGFCVGRCLLPKLRPIIEQSAPRSWLPAKKEVDDRWPEKGD